MSEPGKLKRKRTMSRQEAAAWLSILAEALRADATIDVEVVGERVSLQPADEIRTRLELKSRPDKQEIEIELSWSPTSSSEAAAAAEGSAEPDTG